MTPEARRTKRRLDRLQGLVLVVVQSIAWSTCVLGASWGLPWLGPCVVAVLAVLHLQYSRSWRRDLALMFLLATAGTAVDSLQMWLGWITFKGALVSWLAPPWITALWFHFGTMRHALLRSLFGRWGAAAACGAVIGPAAYLAGASLGALQMAAPSWRSLLFLAVVWGVALPGASWLAWRNTSFGARRVAARRPAAPPELDGGASATPEP